MANYEDKYGKLTAVQQTRKNHYLKCRDHYARQLNSELTQAEYYFNQKTINLIEGYLQFSSKYYKKENYQQPSDKRFKVYQSKIMFAIKSQLTVWPNRL